MRFLLMPLMTALVLVTPFAAFASETAEPEHRNWAFQGLPTGWDKDRLYRGYTVATQVCMSCHGIKYISHRDLTKAGFSEDEAKALATEMGVGMNDKFKAPLSEEDSKELYGKVVPDLSVMNKAREGGADYVYAVLTGFSEDPEEIYHNLPDGVPEGAYYNRAFPGHAIAMPAPLTGPDMVEYHDGTPATVAQMAEDVTYFLQWTAEPELMDRKHLGVYVLLYVLIFAGLAYLTKRAIWRDIH